MNSSAAGLVLSGLLAGSQVMAQDVTISSLDELSVDALRARSYESSFEAAGTLVCPSLASGGSQAATRLLSYDSDGLRVYARIDVPEGEPPSNGYPVLVFAHGWVGIDAAPTWSFACDEDSPYGRVAAAYRDAGYVVLIPGFRGHGTVADTPADGIEFLAAWDNGTYLSPIFYAIDVLNLLTALRQGVPDGPEIDPDRVYIAGHSQGGDVALAVLAATGEGAASGLSLAGGSIWAGTFPDRVTQVAVYNAMERSKEAFLAGDGTWSGTAQAADGSINPNFVFGYPPDWIGTLDETQWTWQADQWSLPSVRAAVEQKLEEMYGTLNANVGDIEAAAWATESRADGGFTVVHDPAVLEALAKVGGYRYPEYLTEPLNLHFSDRDFYSFPAWNEDLCGRVSASQGRCSAFKYPGNTHALLLGPETWFTPLGTREGFDDMIRRDMALFGGASGEPQQ